MLSILIGAIAGVFAPSWWRAMLYGAAVGIVIAVVNAAFSATPTFGSAAIQNVIIAAIVALLAHLIKGFFVKQKSR